MLHSRCCTAKCDVDCTLDVALLSVPHHICSIKNSFDLRCESVTYQYVPCKEMDINCLYTHCSATSRCRTAKCADNSLLHSINCTALMLLTIEYCSKMYMKPI